MAKPNSMYPNLESEEVDDTIVTPGPKTAHDDSLRSAKGMAAVGAVVGFTLLGPITAVAGALGGAAVCTGLAGEGKHVDAARYVGKAVGDVGNLVYERAKGLNEKHHITDKIADGVSDGAKRISNAVAKK
eukprot:m.334576 g.334576  ORF g.334576 m.334576 type:complete len:130 (-) comp17386_c0_seq1:190-579(-)